MSTRIENEYVPSSVTHPGTTLAEALEERGMSQAQLSERTGRPRKTINEIVKGLTAITPETAIQLERVLGIPATFWNNRQSQFDESVARAQSNECLLSNLDWLGNFPVSQMIKLGWLEKKGSKLLQLEALLSFFGIGSPDEWGAVSRSPWMDTTFRSSRSHQTDPYALSAWLRKGELEAAAMECRPFDKSGFRGALDEIRPLIQETPRGFDGIIQRTCASVGVAVVFVPLVKGVHAWGATRWLSPGKSMLLLSLRGKLEDVFWFTFLHESAHIILHKKRDTFVEGVDHQSADDEGQANSFARDFLIPQGAWKSFAADPRTPTAQTVMDFASRIGTSAAVVVGRLQHEGIVSNNTPLNKLRRRIDFSTSG
jgi:HTH-type transcriptional regulator / antitoxin HigA